MSNSLKTYNQDSVGEAFLIPRKWRMPVLFLFSFLLYANTLNHKFAQDDAIVITDNMFTEKGISGISGLLKYDTFYGFFKVDGKAKLVSGGRYRPLTPIMFAIGVSMFGKNPMVGHFMNAVWYGILVMVLYLALQHLFFKHKLKYKEWLIFSACLLFAAHPVHTEVVANIKGRDEIVSLLCALGTLYFALRFFDERKLWMGLSSGIICFMGLLAKENVVTYLAVIPLALVLFRSFDLRQWGLTMMGPILGFVLFMIIRTSVLGLDFGGSPRELMNNPYLKIVNNQYVDFTASEKYATISYTLGEYVRLLLYPHPLTADYYPRHVGIMKFSDVSVILSVLIYLVLFLAVFWFWKRNKIISFSIAYFVITLSIVSNLVFPIGTNMSERFLFMPSVGFCVLMAYALTKVMSKNKTSALVLFVLILGLYSFKTLDRNMDWKDDYTLYTTDVKTSSKSAKGLNAAGGSLIRKSEEIESPEEKKRYLNQALEYLTQAVKIHPNYKNAHLLKGNANYYLSNYTEAVASYEMALTLDPNYQDALNNIVFAYRDAGRFFGEKQGDLEKAKRYLLKSYELNDKDYETLRLLGVAYGMGNDHRNAVKFFEQAVEQRPNDAMAYMNLANACQNFGDDERARIQFQKAIELDPSLKDRIQ